MVLMLRNCLLTAILACLATCHAAVSLANEKTDCVGANAQAATGSPACQGHPGKTCSECVPGDSPVSDLFYNYYVDPRCGAVYAASMYHAPHATPGMAGGVYCTYQPFLPHEYMYCHDRVYHRLSNQKQGLNRTHVTYRPMVGQIIATNFNWLFGIPR